MNRILAALTLNAALLLGASALANGPYEEKTLSYDSGSAAGYSQLPDEGARTDFETVPSWDHVYLVEVMVFGKRYGAGYDPSKTFANIAVTDRKGKVLAQKLLPLSFFSEQGGWVDAEFSPLELVGPFSVVIYPYSQQGQGLQVGYASASGAHRSWQGNPSRGFEPMVNGSDWMIRVLVRNSLEPRRSIPLAEISGTEFRYLDDGKVDGYATFQRGGALVGFRRNSARMLKEVYFFGKVGGDWFKLKPTFRVYLLDNDLRVIVSVQRDYTVLTEVPHWTVVDFPDTTLSSDFYILIEPVSRPEYSLDIGYDNSGVNRGSFYGTVGTINDWKLEVDHARFNWLVRVKVG